MRGGARRRSIDPICIEPIHIGRAGFILPIKYSRAPSPQNICRIPPRREMKMVIYINVLPILLPPLFDFCNINPYL